jgi:hypothetical protein
MDDDANLRSWIGSGDRVEDLLEGEDRVGSHEDGVGFHPTAVGIDP